jgi:probable O-glycosylation ligase (exosortase A-associated)
MVFLFPSLPVCFVRPFYGVVLWTIIAFTSLQWYAYSANLLPVALLVAVPTALGAAIFGRGWRNLLSFECALLVVLWIWFSLTTLIAGGNPLFADHVADMWLRWQYVSKVFIITLVTIVVVDSFARLRALIIVITGSFAFFVVKALPWLVVTQGAHRVYGPERSMIADNNDFGLALNMTLPLLFFLSQSETRIWVKRLFLGLFLATIPAILFTYSRGAMVGLTAVLGLMLLRSRQRAILIPVLVVGILIAALFAPPAWKDRMDPTTDKAMDRSAYSRINAWHFCWQLAGDYPITGGGFETFTQPLFDRYAPNAADVHGPHSIYFGVLAEHGFVGLFLYLLLVGACFTSTHWIVKWARFNGDEIAANYGNMLRFALVGFLISGIFLGRAYFDYYYTLVACIVILRQICKQAWSKPPELISGWSIQTEAMYELSELA